MAGEAFIPPLFQGLNKCYIDPPLFQGQQLQAWEGRAATRKWMLTPALPATARTPPPPQPGNEEVVVFSLQVVLLLHRISLVI